MRLLLSSLCLILLAASGRCMAQTVIHHCVSANGTPVFTDRVCSSLDATPATAANNPYATHSIHTAQHCAMNIQALRQRVASIFGERNVNALAGLMLWNGYDEHAAADIVEQLAQQMRSPFLGFAGSHHGDSPAGAASAWIPPLAPATSTAPPAALIVKFDNPVQPQTTFPITRRDGCLWLTP